jgi:hypothetical protein
MKPSPLLAIALAATLVAIATTGASWAVRRLLERRRAARSHLPLQPLESWENEGGALASR